MSLLFVVNSGSGAGSVDWEAVISDYFGRRRMNFEIMVLGGGDASAQLRGRIKQFQPAIAVAVGGDGTVSMVAREVVGTSTALAVLPAGSANGMARELDIPETPEAAMDIIAAGKIRETDVIQINNEHICLHLSDIGLNAQLIKHFEEGNLRGKWGYASKIWKTLASGSTMKVRIVTENDEVHHVALMVVLANATKYGTGAVINPVGDLSDGFFEVVIVRRLAISELLKMFFRPQIFNPKKIKIFRARSVTIQTRRPVDFQVDGEYIGRINFLEANILNRQLKLIVP